MLTGMTASTPKLRWFQFSLRTLLIVVTLCAIPCSWLAVKMRRAEREKATAADAAKRRQEAVAAAKKLGGYDPRTGLLILEGFTLQLPLGSHHQTKQGEDSICGTITLGKGGLTLDYAYWFENWR